MCIRDRHNYDALQLLKRAEGQASEGIHLASTSIYYNYYYINNWECLCAKIKLCQKFCARDQPPIYSIIIIGAWSRAQKNSVPETSHQYIILLLLVPGLGHKKILCWDQPPIYIHGGFLGIHFFFTFFIYAIFILLLTHLTKVYKSFTCYTSYPSSIRVN